MAKIKDPVAENAQAEQTVQMNINQQAQMELLKAEQVKRQMLEHYQKEEKVDVHLSPAYQAYFGRIMQVRINGCTIAFPVDGTTQKVAKTFADEINRRRMAVDKVMLKRSRMANYRDNYERNPGDLSLF